MVEDNDDLVRLDHSDIMDAGWHIFKHERKEWDLFLDEEESVYRIMLNIAEEFLKIENMTKDMEFDKIEFLVKEMKDAVKKMNDVAKLLDEENVLFHIDTDSETMPSPNVRFPLRCSDFYTTETKITYYGK